MGTSLSKIIVGVITLIVVGFFGYKIFLSPADTTIATNQDQNAQQILDLAAKLDLVSIDPSLFSKPVFTSLHDFTPALLSEPQGKEDPFSSISSGQMDTGFVGSVALPVKKK